MPTIGNEDNILLISSTKFSLFCSDLKIVQLLPHLHKAECDQGRYFLLKVLQCEHFSHSFHMPPQNINQEYLLCQSGTILFFDMLPRVITFSCLCNLSQMIMGKSNAACVAWIDNNHCHCVAVCNCMNPCVMHQTKLRNFGINILK